MNHLDTVLVNDKFFLKNKKILGLQQNYFLEMEFNSISFYKKMLLFKNGYFSLSFNVGKVVATIAKSKKTKVLKFSVCFFKIKMQRFNYFHKNKTKTKNQKTKQKQKKQQKI